MIAVRVARGVKNHFVGRNPEWLLAILCFGLGFRLLGAENTFDSSPSFAVMKSIASENHWGVGMVIIGGLRLIALTVNGTFKTFARFSPFVRTVMSMLTAFVWFAIGVGFYNANPAGWGWFTYFIVMAMDIISATLAGGDAGAVQRRLRNGSSG